jgi:hypothetical protein
MAIVRVNRNTVDVFLDASIAGGGTDIFTLPVIPNGDRWRLRLMGMADPATGDGIASIVALQLGPGTWNTIRAFSAAGTTVQIEIDREITGNGTRQLRVVRQNPSAVAKQIVAWLEGYKVE